MPTPIKIAFDDARARAALASLREKTGNLRPVLLAIGEDLEESTKRRFSTATAPDGTPWAPNTETTILRYLGVTRGNYNKDGSLSKKGTARLGAKKPLSGESRSLSTTIHHQVRGNVLEVGSPKLYSGTQQFGAAQGSLGPNAPWGDVPARPFLGLSAEDRSMIERLILDYLST